MRKLFFALIACVLVAGCKPELRAPNSEPASEPPLEELAISESPSEEPAVSEQPLEEPALFAPARLPDVISDSGLMVYIEVEGFDYESEIETLRSVVEDSVNQAQSCLGMLLDEPPLAVVTESPYLWLQWRGVDIPENAGGYALFGENLIVIKYSHIDSKGVWSHEIEHIVLHQNGFDPELNSNHQPGYIWENCKFSDR